LPDTLATDRYVDEKVRRTFYDRLLARLSTLPGVEHASLSSSLPIYAFNSSRNFAVEGRADPPRGQEPLADNVIVSPDFFATLGLQLVEGRLFPATLRENSPAVAVINETMARQLWPGESAIGRRIGDNDPKQRNWVEIIGVVRDVGFVGNFGLPDTRLQIYRPLVQEPWGYLNIALRARHPETLAEPLRRAVAELDPDLPVADLFTVRQSVDRAQHNFQIANQLLAGFALLGLALAAIGLYGVISTLVVQRTAEFGIRLALGAQTRDVLWLVLGQSLWLAGAGCVLGLAGAAGLVIFLGRMLPGLPGAEPIVLAGTVLLLLGVALGACWFPARRATQVDPIVALRAE
jgi:predicted permease